jgi:hypothetical protein
VFDPDISSSFFAKRLDKRTICDMIAHIGESEMHKAVKIELTRAEGPMNECARVFVENDFYFGIPHLTDDASKSCWQHADAVLRSWSHTAPDGGGYDKCDFIVVFDDGENYRGRFDLVRTDNLSLAEHVKQFLMFYAGLRKPDHITEDQYKRAMKRGDTEACQVFLDHYEIPA